MGCPRHGSFAREEEGVGFPKVKETAFCCVHDVESTGPCSGGRRPCLQLLISYAWCKLGQICASRCVCLHAFRVLNVVGVATAKEKEREINSNRALFSKVDVCERERKREEERERERDRNWEEERERERERERE